MTGVGFAHSRVLWLPHGWEDWPHGQRLTVQRTGRGLELAADVGKGRVPKR